MTHRLPRGMSGGRKEASEWETLEMEGESQRKHEQSSLKPPKAPRMKGCEEIWLCQHLVLCHVCGHGKVHLRGVAVNGVAPGLQRLYLGEGTLRVVPGRGDEGTSQCRGHPPACARRGQSLCAPPSPFPADGNKINPHVKYNHPRYLGSDGG